MRLASSAARASAVRRTPSAFDGVAGTELVLSVVAVVAVGVTSPEAPGEIVFLTFARARGRIGSRGVGCAALPTEPSAMLGNWGLFDTAFAFLFTAVETTLAAVIVASKNVSCLTGDMFGVTDGRGVISCGGGSARNPIRAGSITPVNSRLGSATS